LCNSERDALCGGFEVAFASQQSGTQLVQFCANQAQFLPRLAWWAHALQSSSQQHQGSELMV